MVLAQWDPFGEISRIHDRVFGRPTLEREYTFRPAVDIFEDAEGIHVKAEIPGVKPDEINVDVHDNVLTISGERKLEHEDNKEGYHRVERFYGSYSRSFALPGEISTEDIDAKYEDGVLHLTLPKRPEAKRRQVAVKKQ